MKKNPALLNKTNVIVLLIFFMLLSSSAFAITKEKINWNFSSYAQESTSNIILHNGSLLGYVNDTTGNPIEGALVRVHFHGTYEEDYSDSAGFYHVTNIPICYCMKNTTCSKEGYKTEWVLLSIAENTNYDFVLTSGNNPPTKPEVDGPCTGKPGMEICFLFYSTDFDNDSVMYTIDWGDGNITETDHYPSDIPVEVCHTWIEKGRYIFRCKATDIHGAESGWLEREFWVDNSRASHISIYQLFLEKLPILFRFLELINIY